MVTTLPQLLHHWLNLTFSFQNGKLHSPLLAILLRIRPVYLKSVNFQVLIICIASIFTHPVSVVMVKNSTQGNEIICPVYVQICNWKIKLINITFLYVTSLTVQIFLAFLRWLIIIFYELLHLFLHHLYCLWNLVNLRKRLIFKSYLRFLIKQVFSFSHVNFNS